jgi:acetylornithine aminotransferase
MTNPIMPTYARLPVTFTKGSGVWLTDDQNNRYLDALSGIAVCGLGHSHPAVTEALCSQAATLLHTSNLYNIPLQEQLANRLSDLSGMDNMFFCNSGAEANEAAIKIARLHGHNRGFNLPKIIVMENSFHGRTLSTLSATGNPKVQEGFTPLVEGFIRVPYNDIKAIKQAAEDYSDIVAILVEPVQGESGVRIPTATYLNQLRDICDQQQWFLMLDEVQTGIGRTGKFFAYQHNQIIPDVCTLAKGLGNGMPIGACMARGTAAAVLTAGTHGSTFGGNPLACSAALAVLETMQSEALPERAEALGNKIASMLTENLSTNSEVTSIRNKGLMIGIELKKTCTELVAIALENKLLINVAAGNTIRLLPPLIINDDEAALLVEKLTSLINTFTKE